MLCKKCGNQVGDGEFFCPHCGIMLDGASYPEVKEQLNEDLFVSVYYGPDYYQNREKSENLIDDSVNFDLDCLKDKDGDKDLKEDEKKGGLKKIKGWLSRKGNKL